MNGFAASILAGMCTGIGALPLIFVNKISKVFEDFLLGFAAGIMLFAASFSLILPALEQKQIFQVIMGLLAGAVLIGVIEKIIPNINMGQVRNTDFESKVLAKTIMMVTAIAIHNIPEGFAIGVGYATGSQERGIVLAMAMGIQNAPEGLVVSAPLIEKGYSKSKAILFAFFAGIGEPIAAAVGILAGKVIQPYMPFTLSLAAGAMYYVVSHELIPESHCHGNQVKATFGVIAGFVVMLLIEHYIVK
ncbi:zinc transporter, ZIP family [Geosporobacter subterraneus DSM 17957]|uniref:Zinc transporter, ZIP family n=1 Tax=Geosporobacter subterraneus DSM 17957 TaxID=1121919 RepID=A0A1M6G7G9_9FIRM|nr:ZIP family metal transporter [Geosporobacter subterraneus]SHJ05852.1 zinc transporter, ZIP family [Geosporobacter subterraneus DSM 17957]